MFYFDSIYNGRRIYTVLSFLGRPLLRHKRARQKRYGRITQEHRRINKYKNNKTLVYGRENGRAGQRAVEVTTKINNARTFLMKVPSQNQCLTVK